MFETFEIAPKDPILGLSEAFIADTDPDKINLGVGVYKNAEGQTPILDCVQEAESRLLSAESSKGYLPITGAAEYGSAVQKLMFGAGHEVLSTARAATAHTPGGTGALRVAGEFIHKMLPAARLWLSSPTWPNHPNVFRAAGVETVGYPYFDADNNRLDFDAMLATIEKIPAGDVLLLHGCCHNPTGVDPTTEQWAKIAEVVSERGILPLLDFAYQGFADGLTEDAAGLHALAATGGEMLVCSSFSKNFGLYRERVGALSVIGSDADGATKAMGHIKGCIRANYSNPPAHGGAIVTTILGDDELTAQWQEELATMRDRINQMRSLLVDTLASKGVDRDFSFIKRQRGMFSFSGLTRGQVDRLREEDSIYIVGSGRINVAGMTESNMDRLCRAIARVLAT